jgi:hypothetical protein
MTSLHTKRGLDRLVNFTDVAVAIAITLLILPSVDFAAEISRSSLWLVRHRLFELVADSDLGLLLK